MREVIAGLRGLLDELDPACLSPAQAVRLVEDLAEVERLAAAGKTLAAGRAACTGAWDGDHRDFASWLAAVSGTTVGAARATVETATRLRELPATEAALRTGALSSTQAGVVADAATADPASESSLLASAAVNGVKGLRDDCAKVKAAALSRDDELARYAKAVEARSVRHYQDADGLGRIDIRGPVDDTARIMARLEPTERLLFEQARKAGERERPDALAFDALCQVTARGADPTAEGRPSKGRVGAEIVVHVSHTALTRGHTQAGEHCEIAGIGPIPVAVAQRLADDAILKALLVDGHDIRAVAHLGRTIPAHLRTYIEARDRECAIAGCHVNRHLEMDHNTPFALGGKTDAENLNRLCRHHHDLKTRYNGRLVGPRGAMRLVNADDHPPPGEPRSSGPGLAPTRTKGVQSAPRHGGGRSQRAVSRQRGGRT